MSEGIELMQCDSFTVQLLKGKQISQFAFTGSTNTTDWFDGARAHYFGNICHDWLDEYDQMTLTKTGKAIEKDYRRIIHTFVLSLPGASTRTSAMDFLMKMYASGIECTKQ